MLTSPRSLFAAGVLIATAFTSSLAAASSQNAKVPDKYASLVPADVYAVGWIENVNGLLESAKATLPPDADVPSSMKELLTTVLAIGPNVKVGNSVIAWAAEGPSMAEGRHGDPQIFIAFSASGANAQNTHAGHDTTLHFNGDMIIAAEGKGVDWTKPDGAPSRLIPMLMNDQASIAVDVEKIWKHQGQQIQMLGGFGAMAAQMALMEQSQNADPSEKARIKEAQKKIGEVMRNSMAGIFNLIKTMDTMVMGIGMDQGMLSFTSDFNFTESIGGGRGVAMKVIDGIPGGMPFYYAMDAEMVQWFVNLELNLEDAIMIGLSKKQHTDFDAIIPMIKDLNDTITGGMAVGMDMHHGGLMEYTEIQVQDSQEFIKGFELVMNQVDKVNLGVNYSNEGNDTWKVSLDGQKLAASMDNPQIQQIDNIPFIQKGIAMNVSSKGDFVTIKAVMGDEVASKNSSTTIREMLRPNKSYNLMVGAAVDIRAFVLKAMQMMMPHASESPKMKKLMADESTIPLKVLGSFQGKTFKINFDTDVVKLMKFQNQIQQSGF